jgi:ABC-type branched-subunit amino acid transport system substrate-binding protein
MSTLWNLTAFEEMDANRRSSLDCHPVAGFLSNILVRPFRRQFKSYHPAEAAKPVRIGITTILSGPMADRGQSEQYGAQLALNGVNAAGGISGRPVEAYYADNVCNPTIGVTATKRLIEQEHVRY